MKIFISVASYCDDNLGRTVAGAFKEAKYPKNLIFGVVEQEDDDQRWKIPPTIRKQVRYVGIDPRESRGACWARSLCMSMYGDEDWFFQIDAHTLFEKDWDERLIKAAEGCLKISPKPIVSSYPNAFERADGVITRHIFRGVPVHIIKGEVDPKSYKLQFVARKVKGNRPVRAVHLAGGCLFTLGKFVYEVPYDPYMYFNGEEQAIAVKAYTHGWDMFHVPDLPLYHLYTSSKGGKRQRHWDPEITKERAEHWSVMQKRAVTRLSELIDGKDMGVYGLGKERTMQDYIDFSGVDYFNKSVGGRALRQYWDNRNIDEGEIA